MWGHFGYFGKMTLWNIWILLWILNFMCVKSQILFTGRCPRVQVMTTFEPEKFSGIWFEVERTRFSAPLRCVKAEYYFDGKNMFSAVTKGIDPSGRLLKFHGEMRIANESEPAKMVATSIPASGNQIGNAVRPYWVIYADYDQCAVIYRCVSDFIITHRRYAWILCRQYNVTTADLFMYRSVLASKTAIPPQQMQSTFCK